MARRIGRLTALAVSRAKQPGMHADGGGLYLQVTGSQGRSWVYRYARGGKTRYMGLGSLTAVSLAEARTRAAEARRLVSAGIDPIGARDGKMATERAAAAKQVTFAEAAEAFIKAHKAGWRNAKHGQQWRNTLAAHVHPLLGALPVQQIDAGLVVRVLEPIGARRPRPPAGSASASRRCWIRRRHVASGPARTPPGGVATWKTSCRRCPRSSGFGITPRCPTPSLAPSWPICGSRKGLPPGRWSCSS